MSVRCGAAGERSGSDNTHRIFGGPLISPHPADVVQPFSVATLPTAATSDHGVVVVVGTIGGSGGS